PHWIGPRKSDACRCAWCAPTPIAVVAVLPSRSVGGAGLAALPWQAEQVPLPLPSVSAPSTCNAGLMKFRFASTTRPWQLEHCVKPLPWLLGGRPWHVPQAAWPVPGSDQFGFVLVAL